ncbi:hypothetical protein Bca52824_075370 [Brassica carinata]|uniref:Neprosin PEP catalytic domain-containing protein n=1 Tax=Brassica carinata TaxID=52824 RepID=A0A8X7PQ99_BRACI|nr:hypothetical protein Bca52824_075370 [Brassica carinata]
MGVLAEEETKPRRSCCRSFSDEQPEFEDGFDDEIKEIVEKFNFMEPVASESDAYQATGCYNFLGSGFIQINSNIAMEASISPVSGYCNLQYDISILIWKDPKEH